MKEDEVISKEEALQKKKEYALEEKMAFFAIIAGLFLLSMPIGEIISMGRATTDTKTALVIFAVMLVTSIAIFIRDVYKLHQIKKITKNK